jgi:hypothetical protein
MTTIILLTGKDLSLAEQSFSITDKESSMTKQIRSHRYELVQDEDADFIAYQRNSGGDVWRTVSTWMIPRTLVLPIRWRRS